MRGRVLNIKKTTLLMLSFILQTLLFLCLSTITIFVWKQENLYLFVFMLCVGIHLIFKSLLFRLDSACYFGIVLFCLGIFYFYCFYLKILPFYVVFVLISLAIASLVCGMFFSQPLHYTFVVFCIFLVIGVLLFLIKNISLIVFLAIVVVSVLLLVVRILSFK